MGRNPGVASHSTGIGQVDCADAARQLGVTPTALAHWSRELGFPRDVGTPGSPRFARHEIDALARALPHAYTVSGAIRVARRRIDG